MIIFVSLNYLSGNTIDLKIEFNMLYDIACDRRDKLNQQMWGDFKNIAENVSLHVLPVSESILGHAMGCEYVLVIVCLFSG